MVSFSHKRHLLCDKGESTSAGQCKGNSAPHCVLILAFLWYLPVLVGPSVPSPNHSRPPDVSKAAGWDFAGRSVVGGTANRQHRPLTPARRPTVLNHAHGDLPTGYPVERDKFGHVSARRPGCQRSQHVSEVGLAQRRSSGAVCLPSRAGAALRRARRESDDVVRLAERRETAEARARIN